MIKLLYARQKKTETSSVSLKSSSSGV